MTTQMIIEVQGTQGARTIVQALEAYKTRLRAGIERTKRRLAMFEVRYGELADVLDQVFEYLGA